MNQNNLRGTACM